MEFVSSQVKYELEILVVGVLWKIFNTVVKIACFVIILDYDVSCVWLRVAAWRRLVFDVLILGVGVVRRRRLLHVKIGGLIK